MRRAAAVLVVVLGLAACGTRGAGSTSGTAGGSPGTSSSASASSATTPSGGGRVSVSPAAGGPATVFTVRFVAPASAGPAGQIRTGYTVSVTGGHGSGCLGAASVQAGAATAGVATPAALDPARLGGRWCPGRHEVRVIETGAPVCKPGMMCPQYLRVIGTVGVARFNVTG